MADKKISQLTDASLPLAGTEVLPIVQSNTTVKVAVSDLTSARAISAAQITVSTGNVIVNTAGKGIDFSANTNAAGMTSELLTWYEEGTWIPVVVPGAGSITTQTCSGLYTRIGRLVTLQLSIVINNAGTASSIANISGLPFTSANVASVGSGAIREYASVGSTWCFTVSPNATTMLAHTFNNSTAFATGYAWRGSLTYMV